MQQEPQQLQRVVIKEELVALTGDIYEAALLNNLIFWQGVQNKGDQTTLAKIEAAERRGLKPAHIEKMKKTIRNGWFYKSADELLLDLINWGSNAKITRATKKLEEKGYLEKGNNPDPKAKWDRTTWYRINLQKIQADLFKLGYALDGYTLPNTAEKGDEPAPLRIFQNEKWILQNEKSTFQNEKSILQNERTIPEGFSEGFSKAFKSSYIFKPTNQEEYEKWLEQQNQQTPAPPFYNWLED